MDKLKKVSEEMEANQMKKKGLKGKNKKENGRQDEPESLKK